MKYLLLPLLIIQYLIVSGQESTKQQVIIRSKYNQHIAKKKSLPAKIYYKSKNSKGKKTRTILYDIRNDTLICKSESSDTLFLVWKDLKWVQVERSSIYSLIYDGALLASYYGVGVSAFALSYGFLNYDPNVYGSGNAIIIGFYAGFVFVPTAIALTVGRFREFTPEYYQIEKRSKVIKH